MHNLSQMEHILLNSGSSFKDFLFKVKFNASILWVAFGVAIVQFLIFKYLYPFASFIHGDSFEYIIAADKNSSISTYPIGYSKFLRLFSVFTKSDTALVSFQYFLLQACSLFFCFSVKYLFRISNTLLITLIVFFVINPLSLNLSNLISSDSLFVSISLLWVTTLLWYAARKSSRVLVYHCLFLLIAFTIRYNALIYPIITLAVIMLCKISAGKKVIAAVSVSLPVLLFILLTSFEYKHLTGYFQFSPFGGWQLANNGMYAYKYVDSTDLKRTPVKYAKLDSMVLAYFVIARDTARYPFDKEKANTFYMWSPGLPLMKYMNSVFEGDSVSSDFKKWASMGPYYKEYGLYLIKEYPFAYLEHFMLPNSIRYYAPPLEFLEYYNSAYPGVDTSAVKWFGYKNREVKTRTANGQLNILKLYPILSGAINFVMLMAILSILFLGGFKEKLELRVIVKVGLLLWIINAVFTITVSSASLRFQTFPIYTTTAFALVYIEWIFKKAFQYTIPNVSNPKVTIIQSEEVTA